MTRENSTQPFEIATRQDGAVSPDPSIIDPAEHNVVFTNLVTGDRDIVGLVAYSIYKQNKYDWLQAYSRLQGRMPNAEEAQAYLLGESTPRRLATYRHLAEAVLDGRGPDVPGTTGGDPSRRDELGRPAFRTQEKTGQRVVQGFTFGPVAIVALVVVLVAAVAMFWLLRNGAPLPPPTPAK